MTWVELLEKLGVFSVAALFIQQLIKDSSTKAIEKYKQELQILLTSHQLNLNVDLERYKSELTLNASKQTSLHQKRSEIIDQTYKNLALLDSAMRTMARSIQLIYEDGKKVEQERVDNAQKAYIDFNTYFLLNKLYFDKATGDLLENVRNEYWSANFDYFTPKRLEGFTGGRPSDEGYKEAIKKSQDAIARIQNEIPKILIQLENQFRKILGVG